MSILTIILYLSSQQTRFVCEYRLYYIIYLRLVETETNMEHQ